MDPVLKKVAARLSETAGRPVSEAQVLQLWLRKKGFVIITLVTFHCAKFVMTNSIFVGQASRRSV